ncbi:unnamed protein product [Didymodactylos carnosus]|uniref:Uncharacterized protein n=1 Tax=Didymodactylos carnosus TaxID=1234261 RepID=A0A8S2SYQ5_9BILA|nr:unnamed protein product [Didymodactylos carnosus]CAF4259704.1 unnamed protein product [Didymodactylos carnosus]
MVAVDGMSRNIDAIAGKNRYYATVTTREYREALKVLEDAAACKLNYSNRTYADAIEKLIVRNSEYDSALLCGKNEDNYYHLELRKFYADHRILDSEKKIIINYMLHCLPDLEKGIYRPAVTLISNDDDLVSFFKFYNGSGRENIDKDAGGMYAIIKNMEFGGMMSIRQSVIDPEAAEMSLYLREFLQNKKVGARLISRLLRKCFLEIEYPLSALNFVFRPWNERINSIFSKLNGTIFGAAVNSENENIANYGTISREFYVKKLTENGDAINQIAGFLPCTKQKRK